jgi:hypothetical protein
VEASFHKKKYSNNQQHGNHVISVSSGELASGLFGEGRMQSRKILLGFLKKIFFGVML